MDNGSNPKEINDFFHLSHTEKTAIIKPQNAMNYQNNPCY